MARDVYAYRDVAVESCWRDGQVKICPVPGQAYSNSLLVHCARSMSDTETYPLGTQFLVSAKLTDRLGGTPFLYVYHGDPVKVLTPKECDTFLGKFIRGRI
ncbi:hypothetical protein [Pseudoduganella aquatica]|uniref:Uncharacterized protein n=1 Tax=Pseudoduganella aquatica TaxID=2660641 RepID=A0A7X4HB41_9BURK|nr:hypothetical protein [Pseudoduganella aquatica]MYN07568.1 hypothetical protein [Pseudoduganella aquatica]